jgi:hypothetical protein
MNKQKLSKIINIAVCIGILSFTVFAYIWTLNVSHEKIVREFWSLVLNNQMDKAELLTEEHEGKLASIKPQEFYGGGRGKGADGKDIDIFYRDDIYEKQIKIDRVTEVKKRDYRAGVRLETTDKDGHKSEFIVCLGEVQYPTNTWKITLVTLSNVFNEKETIEDDCFEKPREENKP